MQATRRIAAALAVSALVLSGCSDNPDNEETGAEETATTAETETPSDTETAPPEVDPLISDEGMPAIVEDDGNVTLDFEGATEPEVLQVSVVDEGDGPAVTREDLVFVNYAGMVWGSDTTFDSSYDREQASAFPLTGVVQGWRDGLAGQKVGSTVVISVPAELGYGPNGGQPAAGIGPEDTIVFAVEVLDTLSPDATGDPDAEEVTPVDELPVDIDGGLGELTTITIRDDAAEPEEETSVMVAESDGEPVGGDGTTVYIQYSAASWDNSQTESTIDFGGVQNTTIGSDTVFDQLEGVPVGSRILLLIPGADETTPGLAALVDVVGQLEAPAESE